VSGTGELRVDCEFKENDVGIMPHQAALPGKWNRDTGQVTFELLEFSQ